MDTLDRSQPYERLGESYGSYPVLRVHDHAENDLAGRIDGNAVRGLVPVQELLDQLERGARAWRSGAGNELRPLACGGVAPCHALGEVLLAGQPSREDLAAARDLGVRTVIDLRRPGEMDAFDEPALVEDLGMRYVPLPIGGADDLTDALFERARALLNEAERPILLHCASANRVGALWLAWRALDGDLPPEAARAEARTVGLRSPALEERARAYVEGQRSSD